MTDDGVGGLVRVRTGSALFVGFSSRWVSRRRATTVAVIAAALACQLAWVYSTAPEAPVFAAVDAFHGLTSPWSPSASDTGSIPAGLSSGHGANGQSGRPGANGSAEAVPALYTTATAGSAAQTAVAFARAQLGLPYEWGGDGPSHADVGFDCSGLTHAAYAAAAVPLPRTAQTQYNAGPQVAPSSGLQAGDLVFYGTPTHVHHVGLYIGNDQMINAPTFGKPVQIASYRWSGDDFLGASRPAAGSDQTGTLPRATASARPNPAPDTPASLRHSTSPAATSSSTSPRPSPSHSPTPPAATPIPLPRPRLVMVGGVPLPDRALTPGAVSAGATRQGICTSGYPSRAGQVTASKYVSVYAAYHIAYPPPAGAYELDHLIPVELGGDNSTRNLWPEPRAVPGRGYPTKDQLENRLHDLVCAGQLSLATARQAIATNWYAAYRRYGGAANAHSAPPLQPQSTHASPTGAADQRAMHPGASGASPRATGHTTTGTPITCRPASDRRNRRHRI